MKASPHTTTTGPTRYNAAEAGVQQGADGRARTGGAVAGANGSGLEDRAVVPEAQRLDFLEHISLSSIPGVEILVLLFAHKAVPLKESLTLEDIRPTMLSEMHFGRLYRSGCLHSMITDQTAKEQISKSGLRIQTRKTDEVYSQPAWDCFNFMSINADVTNIFLRMRNAVDLVLKEYDTTIRILGNPDFRPKLKITIGKLDYDGEGNPIDIRHGLEDECTRDPFEIRGVVIDGTNSLSGNSRRGRRQRMQDKLLIRDNIKMMEDCARKLALNRLKKNRAQWEGLLKISNEGICHKINAYQLFELLFIQHNQRLYYTSEAGRKREDMYRVMLCRISEIEIDVYTHMMGILLPYFEECTKATENNSYDRILEKIIPMLRDHTVPERLKEEFDKYEAMRIAAEKQRARRKRKAQARSKSKAQRLQAAEKKALAAREMEEEAARVARLEADRRAHKKEVQKARASRQQDLARRKAEKGEAIDARQAERHAERVEAISSSASPLSSSAPGPIGEGDSGGLIKIHYLPNREQIDGMIDSLKGKNLAYFNCLFGINGCSPKATLTPENIIQVAGYFRDKLIAMGLEVTGSDLLNDVRNHKHPIHGKAKTEKLPANYVEILRSFFIIFGVFPGEGKWEASSSKELDAMYKYYQRIADRQRYGKD